MEKLNKYNGFFFNYAELYKMADEKRETYKQGSPFPHIVLDDFISRALTKAVLENFPKADQSLSQRDNSVYIKGKPIQHNKVGIRDETLYSETLRHLFWELNSLRFIQFLEKLTGINALLPDPTYRGGGIHQTKPGGMLQIHADFNKHPVFGLDRRINFLLYLNEDWQPNWGGDLELWSKDLTTCEKVISPIAGRCVIFNTTSDSWHGHPEPIACPEGNARKSLALYYYTNGRPAHEEREAHKVLWQFPDRDS